VTAGGVDTARTTRGVTAGAPVTGTAVVVDGERDTGLFGPGSVTWRVHAEPILLLGGLRALFLQALHPRAMAGVAQNSTYRTDPWGRFMRTVDYVATTIYGTTAQAQRAGRRVRAVHARLTAIDPDTGERFRLDDPELLRWVHVAEIDSYVEVARRAGVRLPAGDWDRYWDEQRRAAALVGLDPDTVPGTAAEAAAYLRRMRPRLRVTREAVEAVMFMAAPPPPWRTSGLPGAVVGALARPPFRLAVLALAATAFGLLPPWARRMYGAAGLPLTDWAASLSARSLRLAMSAVPRNLYEGPRYREAMGRAAAAGIDAGS
jgi:uncharacterized protein (DUF2236 family)